MESLDGILDAASAYRKDKAAGQFNLFDTDCLPGGENAADAPISDLSEWDDVTKLSFEREMLGFYITGHPLTRYDDLIKKYTNASSVSLAGIPESSPVRLAGLVKSVKEINTKRGDRMAFVDLEDLEGVAEVTVFSDLYAESRDLLKPGEAVMISGARDGEKDNPKVLAQEICRLEEAPGRFSNAIHIRIMTTGTDPAGIRDLKRILNRHRGNLPVKLHVIVPNRTETIMSLSSISCEAGSDLLSEVNETFGYSAVSFE